jgi:hypoxanthine phosphoribosyltransferase
VIITPDNYERDYSALAEILKKYNVSRLFGIMKGGLQVALCMSYRMSDITVLPIFKTPKVFSLPTYFVSNLKEDDFVIDDIIDSGETLIGIKQYYPRAKFASLYSKIPIHGLPDDVIVHRYLDTKEYVYLPFQEPIDNTNA